MRNRLVVMLSVLVLAALACTVTGGDGDETSTATPLPTLPPLPTPTLMSSPTPTGMALPDASQVPPTDTACTPNTLWQYTYTVQTGDTLGTIADRVGLSAAQLAQANCLRDANLIYAGQVLRVPSYIAPPTPVPTAIPSLTPAPSTTPAQGPTGPTLPQNLTVQRHWIGGDGVPVTYLDTVSAELGPVPTADTVEFYVIVPGGAAGALFATDEDPWNEAEVTYRFSGQGVYSFYAIARSDQGTTQSNTFTIRYDPSFIPPEGRPNLLAIQPATIEQGAYVLTPGSTVTITWSDAPRSALRVDFVLTPTGSGTGSAADVIVSDNNPGDGASVQWTVPGGLSGHLQAEAIMPAGSATQRSEIVLIVAN